MQGPEKYSLCLRNTKFIHIFELTCTVLFINNIDKKTTEANELKAQIIYTCMWTSWNEYLFFFLHFGIFGIFMLLYWTILCQFWTVNLTSILKSVFVKVWQPCNAMVRNDSINILTIENNLYEFFKWCKTLLFI